MKTILIMPEKNFDSTKHQSLHANPIDPNKAIVLFVAFKSKLHLSEDDLLLQKGAGMNYPFETTKKGHPILDTEEKLQWYMNRLLHREVDLYYVNAEACDLETVWLRRRRCENLQQCAVMFSGADPSFIEPDRYGCVDRSVVAVLRAIHSRREAEMEAKRKEIGEKERELRNKTSAIVKEFKKEMRRREEELWKTILA